MSNQRNSLSDSVKEQILLESDDPKCVITKLASKHGVTANQIYNWRSKQRTQPKHPSRQTPDNFVELVSTGIEESPRPIGLCCMNRRFDVFPLSPKYWFKRYA